MKKNIISVKLPFIFYGNDGIRPAGHILLGGKDADIFGEVILGQLFVSLTTTRGKTVTLSYTATAVMDLEWDRSDEAAPEAAPTPVPKGRKPAAVEALKG